MSQFDGTKETKPAPERPTGEDVVKELEELRPVTHGQSSTDTSQLSIFSIPGKPFGKANVKEKHKNMLLDAGITNVEKIHKLEFVNWFNQRIIQLYNEGQVDKKMVSLARDITWSAVTEIKPRNLYEMPIDGGPYQEEIQSISTSNENEDDQIQLFRFELDAIIVE
ncbi:hypothetical protein JRO89_XSUnG0047500 [Xanthoceras sorbifolium]|uniref:Uncharacterized protein n=1 Tax=Xanthoceras sorbifolium TaxID=99658 RepID=A0ABQ8GZV7_9ROSI|nr:hypothetical protein JRO89_XSUnG0047500 [Xanthoceras sorbifolium]